MEIPVYNCFIFILCLCLAGPSHSDELFDPFPSFTSAFSRLRPTNLDVVAVVDKAGSLKLSPSLMDLSPGYCGFCEAASSLSRLTPSAVP